MGKKFIKLERKIERNERAAHPGYSESRIEYIAKARAGEVARYKHTGCLNCRMGIPHAHR